jgi:hypothetical protein
VVIGALGKINEGVFSKEKLRRLKLLRLIDSLTIGDPDSKENLDATEFALEYERELILHRGKG